MHIQLNRKNFEKIKPILKIILDKKNKIINTKNDTNSSESESFYVPLNQEFNTREDILKLFKKENLEDQSKIDFSLIEDKKVSEIKKKNKKEKENFKDALEKLIPKDLHGKIKTAYDTVGDIAILEIPEELKEYEKEMGKILLEKNPAIKTVVKKSGFHSGTFRIQKHEHVAGLKKKSSIVKENNISLKIDIDKTYYSVRMSTERKRIFSKVKPKEKVLVMFSGIGPYVYSISKNTKADFVYGIEINKNAHKMSFYNKELNKCSNTLVLNGDVREIIPNLAKKTMGFELHFDKSDEKKLFDPEIYFLKFNYDEFYEEQEEIKTKIRNLKKKEKIVFLKPEMIKKGKKIDFKHKNFHKFIYDLKKLIKKLSINVVLPLYQNLNKTIMDYLQENKSLNSQIYYSNSYNNKIIPFKTFSQVKEYIKNIYYDMEIAEKSYASFSLIKDEMKLLKNDFNLHFKLNSKDDIKFDKYMNIVSIKYEESDEFKEIYNEFISRDIKFDRIIMPLPKSAEEFLDLTQNISKEGTVVHLYDFLNEEEMDKPKEKINNFLMIHNREVDIKSINKCGQYGPGRYRVCTDFVFKN